MVTPQLRQLGSYFEGTFQDMRAEVWAGIRILRATDAAPEIPR